MSRRIVYEAAMKTRSYEEGVRVVERGTRRMQTAVDKLALSWRHLRRGNHDRAITMLGQAASQTGQRLADLGRNGFDAASKIGRGFSSLLGIMKKVQMQVGLVAAAAIAAGTATVARAAGFESDISRVAILSNADAGQRNGLRENAMQLGTRSPFGLSNIAQTQRQFAQVGYDPDDIVKMTEAASILATMGETDLATAGEALAQVMQQFDIPASKATETALKLSGALVATALNGNELFDAMKDAGSAAGVFGADLSEVLAVVGDLRKSLGGAEKASVAVRNLFLVATNIAGKSDKQLAALGFDREEAQSFSFMRNPGMSLVDKIKGLASKFADNPELATKAGFEMRTILAFKKIEQTSNETFEGLKRQINDTEATMGKVNQMWDLLDAKLGRVKSSADAVFVALGGRLIDAFGVEGAVDGINAKLAELRVAIDNMSNEDMRKIADTLGVGLIHAFSTAVQFLVDSFVAVAPALAAALWEAVKGVAEGILDSDEIVSYRQQYGAMTPAQREAELARLTGMLDGAPASLNEQERARWIGGRHGMHNQRRYEAMQDVLEEGQSLKPYLDFAGQRLANATSAARNRMAMNPTVRAIGEGLEAGKQRSNMASAMRWMADRMGLGSGFVNNGIINRYGVGSSSQRAKPSRPVGTTPQEAAQR